MQTALIPASYLPLYAEKIELFHELPVSKETALELVRAYSRYLTYRTTLEQIARSPASNERLAALAAGAIADEPAIPTHRRTFGGKLATITAE